MTKWGNDFGIPQHITVEKSSRGFYLLQSMTPFLTMSAQIEYNEIDLDELFILCQTTFFHQLSECVSKFFDAVYLDKRTCLDKVGSAR